MHCTDVDQANVLKAVYGDRLLYCEEMGFLCYDGKVWRQDALAAQDMAKRLTDMQLEEAEQAAAGAQELIRRSGFAEVIARTQPSRLAGVLPEEVFEAVQVVSEAESWHKSILLFREHRRLASVLKAYSAMASVRVEELDAHPYLLNTPGGTFDLRTRQMRAHDPGDLLTRITAVSPGDEGEEMWQEMLNTVFCGDGELIAYVRRLCGLMAVGKVLSELLVIAYGDGANGKSSFFGAIRKVLGSYTGTVDTDIIDKHAARNTMPEKASLKGLRMAVASELPKTAVLSRSWSKSCAPPTPSAASSSTTTPLPSSPPIRWSS